MTHSLFRKEIFIETAFERRFQAMLRSAWHKRSWHEFDDNWEYPVLIKGILLHLSLETCTQVYHETHVIVADPGSGKTMGIRDLIKTAGSRAILAVVTPKNNEEEQALGDQLYTALGLPLRGHWSTRKPKLMGHLHQYGTECLIVDDAHDLSLEHLMLLKEVTDQGRLQYDHPLGLCLVAAGRGDTIPLKETFDLPDPSLSTISSSFRQIGPFLPHS
jgi:AAA domain